MNYYILFQKAIFHEIVIVKLCILDFINFQIKHTTSRENILKIHTTMVS